MAEPDSLVPLTEGRELFIGLVAPLGVDLDDAMEVLKASFKGVGYETHEVRMSALLREVPSVAKSLPDPSATEDARIEGYMDAADKLRSDLGTGSVLVHLAMANMRDWRTQKTGSVRPVPHTAVVFNSLKHPDEIRALRKIYGDAFFAISIFTPTKSRIEALSRRIAKSRQSSPDEWLDVAERLVKKDAEAPSVRLGQNVEGTFPLGDFFVRGEHSSIRSEIGRLTDVLFSDPFRTPTVDECGMFNAKAAALRSADLSRQVGAVICDSEGAVLASGCNEVPKPGGGLYWEGDSPDRRDFTLGSDPNAISRKSIVGEVLEALKPLLADQNKTEAELLTNALRMLKGKRISNLLEFGRVVHAEMNALMDAARRGVALRGATLYCTTFPCHVCARHILAAGIRRVVYIEPYPKSLAEEMYREAIVVDGSAGGDVQPDKENPCPVVGLNGVFRHSRCKPKAGPAGSGRRQVRSRSSRFPRPSLPAPRRALLRRILIASTIGRLLTGRPRSLRKVQASLPPRLSTDPSATTPCAEFAPSFLARALFGTQSARGNQSPRTLMTVAHRCDLPKASLSACLRSLRRAPSRRPDATSGSQSVDFTGV